MLILIISLGYIGISILLIAVFSRLIESSPVGLQDDNGFQMVKEKEIR
jgi:hypothetical protein